MTPDLMTPLIRPEYIDNWLTKHSISMHAILEGHKVWPGPNRTLVPLTVREIERLISIDDPYIWAFLNLEEHRDAVIHGVVAARAGDPWALFPIQAQLIRMKGDLIVECGSQVGKTRDIIGHSLGKLDTATGPGSVMVGGDSDLTLEPIWEEVLFQLEKNPRICGGIKGKPGEKPNKKIAFNNGCEWEARLCGNEGRQFRGGHFTLGIYGDECAKWKNIKHWDEFWRSSLPGVEGRIYSMPDGDYSSPFYALCDRAVRVNGPQEAASTAPESDAAVDPETVRVLTGGRVFKKFQISKMDLPFPWWSELVAEDNRVRYGGEHTSGWITNVLGKWGSPAYSVFPMERLEPCLKFIAEYRLVVARVDQTARQISFTAAKLSPQLEEVTGPEREVMLADERIPLLDGDAKTLPEAIAQFFPDMSDWHAPVIACGADVGSAQDPSEFNFARDIGGVWRGIFRLHLAFAEWPLQKAIVARLDHASCHRVTYSFDNGSAGNALAQELRSLGRCGVCDAVLHFDERLEGRGFGDKVDVIDPDTGEPVFNPDKLDSNGFPTVLRLSNKEFGTRVLERKVSGRVLAIGDDGGAGDQKLAAGQLMVNHTAQGVTQLGERRFRGEDDHYVDSWRQLALAFVAKLRDQSVDMSKIKVASSTPRAAGVIFDSGSSPVSRADIFDGVLPGGGRVELFT